MAIDTTKYRKSTSNYVIQEKHQTTDKGDIYERDITTIGGRNFFDRNLRPVYSSGNFVILSSNEISNPKPPIDTVWDKTADGNEEWSWDDVENVSEEKDGSMVLELNPDIYDLRSFAYYGSCSELIRASLNHIVSTFPAELYITEGQIEIEVEDGYYFLNPSNGQKVKSDTLVAIQAELDEAKKKYPFLTNKDIHKNIDKKNLGEEYGYDCIVLNPFGIDLHHDIFEAALVEQNPMKYFSVGENAITYYDVVLKDGTIRPIYKIKTHITREICSENGITFEEDGYDLKQGEKLLHRYCNIIEIFHYDKEVPLEEIDKDKLETLVIHVYRLKGDNFAYLTEASHAKCHIRPKEKYYTKFKENLSIFERLLVSDKTIPKYSPTFEVYTENEVGFTVSMQQFQFPIDYEGGYNLGVGTLAYTSYVSRLSKIAEVYDEYFCDNLWRSMTHEAIKNFDWSFQRDINDKLTSEHIEGGNRLQNMIRLIGREFDEIKAYADGISHANKLTYDGNGNVPDYMLTDRLELEGWDYKHVVPFVKKDDKFVEYEGEIFPYDMEKPILKDSEGNDILPCDTDACEGKPYSSVKIETYNTTLPYTSNDVNNQFARLLALNSKSIWRKKGTIEGIESLLSLFGFKNKEWVESHKKIEEHFTNTLSDSLCPSKNDCDCYEEEIGIPDGARECDLRNMYSTLHSGISHYEIKEYIVPLINAENTENVINLTQKERETWIGINNAKYISYKEDVSLSTIPTNWRGLMVKEKKIGNEYRLYPWFDKEAEYDGKPYYQMYGGWLSKDYALGKNDELIKTPQNNKIDFYFTETLNKVKGFNTLQDLLNIPINLLHEGDVAYITDLTHRYLIIDNVAYEVFEEKFDYDVEDSNNNDKWLYFTVTVTNGAVIIGGKVYQNNLHIIEPNFNNSLKHVNAIKTLNNYANNSVVKIYMYFDSKNKIVNFKLDDSNGQKFNTVLFVDYSEDAKELKGYYVKGYELSFNIIDDLVPTNYFILNNVNYFKNINFYNAISNTQSLGWKQLTEDMMEYKRLIAVEDYYEGNNPHTWTEKSDFGYEYMSYFEHLFKYSVEMNLFDWNFIKDEFTKTQEDVYMFGLSGITDEESCSTYDNAKTVDSKMHYTQKCRYNENTKDEIVYYGTPIEVDDEMGTSVYGDTLIDSDCIINTKRVELIFYVQPTKDENVTTALKYIDTVVIPYLEQMLPSNIILQIKYSNPEITLNVECSSSKP